jgi:dTDP-4-amino-4,6-dideoxygalactose transaminase
MNSTKDDPALKRHDNRYCGLQGLIPIDFLRRVGMGDGWYQGRGSVHYVHKGRCGLGMLCQLWDIGPGDEILVPAYNCGTEIDPFVHYGLELVFYRVDRNAAVDIEDIIGRVTDKTKIVYVTHYFGWPQSMGKIAAYCRARNIRIIEDCALSLFSRPIAEPIGALSDASIYSFPKSLPVPDGGALVVSDGASSIVDPTVGPPAREILAETLPFIKRSVLRLFSGMGLYSRLPDTLKKSRRSGGASPNMSRHGLPGMPASYYFEPSILSLGPSALSLRVVRHAGSSDIVKRRRENFGLLLDAFKGSEVMKPLFHELPDGVCPLFFPVIAEDCDRICAELDSRGIPAMHWWSGYHGSFDWAEFPESKFLKDHLMAIPLHQRLSRDDMLYIIENMSSISGGYHV